MFQVLTAALIALVVAVLAVIPPILHFLTGPVGPAIGGFVACRVVKLSEREVMIMGGLLALVSGVPAYFFLEDLSFLDGTGAIIAAVVAALYVAGLATFAAMFAIVDEPAEDPGEASERASAD